jgi:hypothetical protein
MIDGARCDYRGVDGDRCELELGHTGPHEWPTVNARLAHVDHVAGRVDDVDVDPANGSEPYVDLEPRDANGSAPPVLFTAPDKIVSVARAVAARPGADPKVAALVSVLGSRVGRSLITDRLLELLPPLDDPDEWDELLGMLVGVALNLTSDGLELDVDACRSAGAELLGRVFEE